MSKSLSLMVFLKMQKKDSRGNVPLYVRVTVDGSKDDFSLGHKVQPSEFRKVQPSEFRFRKKDILLGPGINVIRSPLCGRNFEYLSEDPYLISWMSVAYIGVQ
ncbi:MAG TPA: Arm DNA-binding domain-containing protein [Puia sp.]|nr:Arm DNA-binding domain-containing protein [Puia sp.]